ncbi:reverse transcriptase [Phytophthora megakarya]|uniref:Reverse transcriptase n=1 Tax=Phytophthora megakarya TaxID=4795 RepID=A0A225W250_9STRA|nr:reverse transcriptase [Phytophthora megakarya]
MSGQSGAGHVVSDPSNGKCVAPMLQKRTWIHHLLLKINPDASDLDLTWDSDYDECVYYHEGSDLYAEDVDVQIAVLSEVPVTTDNVQVEEIQLCNGLPPAARGVVCNFDVGGVRPITLKCRKLQIQFREKLAGLI